MRVFGSIGMTFLVAAVLVTTAHGAGTRVFTTVDVPGAVTTNVQGVNTQGDIVGTYVDAAGTQHGFLRSGDRYLTIDFPAARLTFARGINDAGDIVGTYQRPGETGGIPAHG